MIDIYHFIENCIMPVTNEPTLSIVFDGGMASIMPVPYEIQMNIPGNLGKIMQKADLRLGACPTG
jgi:hypothetical protein